MRRNVCFLFTRKHYENKCVLSFSPESNKEFVDKKTANNLSHQKAAKMSQESTKEAAKPRRVQLQARSSTEEKKSFRYLKKMSL